jgi:hypothetical protein
LGVASSSREIDDEEPAGRMAISGRLGDQVGQADVVHRTLLAFRMEAWRRRRGAREEGMEALGRLPGGGAKAIVESNVAAPPRANVIDCAGRDRDAQHFLEADRLSAELDFVVVPAAAFAALILDGKGQFGAGGSEPELHEVGDAKETEAVADEAKTACRAKRHLVGIAGGVDTTVIDGAAVVWALSAQTPSTRWRKQRRGQKSKSLRADSGG